ncbi:hypothetical protein AB4Y36_38340 [Paraburkholderia sp. BR10936]|uniref:hypothetical protein n=1 Tax=Paraburkholderia sp. BR10936 TaxID=3236993 RepID=UPI0034D2B52D
MPAIKPLASPMDDLADIVAQFELDAQRAELWINGDEVSDYITADGRAVPTVSKLVAGVNDMIAPDVEAITQGATAATNAANAAATSAGQAVAAAASAAADAEGLSQAVIDAQAAAVSATDDAQRAEASAISAGGARDAATSASADAQSALQGAQTAHSQAAQSATAAGNSATAAGNSATAAAQSALDAQEAQAIAWAWAAQDEGPVDGTDSLSAKQYAQQASDAIEIAAASASEAEAHAAEAAQSATDAAQSATDAAEHADAVNPEQLVRRDGTKSMTGNLHFDPTGAGYAAFIDFHPQVSMTVRLGAENSASTQEFFITNAANTVRLMRLTEAGNVQLANGGQFITTNGSHIISGNAQFQIQAPNGMNVFMAYATDPSLSGAGGIGFGNNTLGNWNFQVRDDGNATVRGRMTCGNGLTAYGRSNFMVLGASSGESAWQSTGGSFMYIRGRLGGGLEFVNHAYNAVPITIDDDGNVTVQTLTTRGNVQVGSSTHQTDGNVFLAYRGEWLANVLENINANANGRAVAGAQCVWAVGHIELNASVPGSDTEVNPNNPWVISGMRTQQSNPAFWPRATWLRNQ